MSTREGPHPATVAVVQRGLWRLRPTDGEHAILNSMTDQAPAGHPSRAGANDLRLVVGCEFRLDSVQPAAAIVQVAPRLQRGVTIVSERWDTRARHHGYVDGYGNRCERVALLGGDSRISYQAELVLAQPADRIAPDAGEIAVGELPHEVLNFVMPSRFCLPDELGHEAWQRFGHLPPGWSRVQAIVDYVHENLEFLPGASNPWTTAADAYRARQGVCRDFAHLAISFCRALNIPARYVFGYIPAIGVPLPAEPMDFAAWFEAYLGGGWHTFDARNNRPRVGRVVVGRGRDAIDVALITSFGPLTLTGFEVRAEPSTLPG
jgi:transglutaminase-like putative cysteine protease